MRRINIGVTFVSRKISDPLFLRVCLFFCYPIESNRRENSNLVVSTLMERVKRSVGLEQRLFRLIDRHKCYNCFPNGFLLRLAFPLPSVSSEITMRSMKFEKIKERINFPLSIRISVCHFFFPMIFRLPNEFYSRSNHFERREILLAQPIIEPRYHVSNCNSSTKRVDSSSRRAKKLKFRKKSGGCGTRVKGKWL